MRRPSPTGGAVEPKTKKDVVGPLLISSKLSKDCIFRMNSKGNNFVAIKKEKNVFVKCLAT
jgi:hypothetical protein